ncbi:hypothetical protein BGZ60DRAFT_437981 [Tricladium varicosporioides]|nr:hypothetical protein BGZ60DRAFT_437981 [Hymenoscyphus varicosporioides]
MGTAWVLHFAITKLRNLPAVSLLPATLQLPLDQEPTWPTDISSNTSGDAPTPKSSKKSKLAESMDWIQERIKERTTELDLLETKKSNIIKMKAQEVDKVEEKRRAFLEENAREPSSKRRRAMCKLHSNTCEEFTSRPTSPPPLEKKKLAPRRFC